MTKPTESDIDQLEDYVGGLYDEMDKLARKSPSADLSDFAMSHVNRALKEAKSLLGAHDRYASDFAPFVEAGENPEVRDALLALREVKQAIGRVERKYKYGTYKY